MEDVEWVLRWVWLSVTASLSWTLWIKPCLSSPYRQYSSPSRINAVLMLTIHGYSGDISLALCLACLLVLVSSELSNYRLFSPDFPRAHLLLQLFFPIVNLWLTFDPDVLLSSSHFRFFVEDQGSSAVWGLCWSKRGALGAWLRTYLASCTWLLKSCLNLKAQQLSPQDTEITSYPLLIFRLCLIQLVSKLLPKCSC